MELYPLLSQGVFEHFDATNQVGVGGLKTFAFAQQNCNLWLGMTNENTIKRWHESLWGCAMTSRGKENMRKTGNHRRRIIICSSLYGNIENKIIFCVCLILVMNVSKLLLAHQITLEAFENDVTQTNTSFFVPTYSWLSFSDDWKQMTSFMNAPISCLEKSFD